MKRSRQMNSREELQLRKSDQPGLRRENEDQSISRIGLMELTVRNIPSLLRLKAMRPHSVTSYRAWAGCAAEVCDLFSSSTERTQPTFTSCASRAKSRRAFKRTGARRDSFSDVSAFSGETTAIYIIDLDRELRARS